MNLCGYEHSGLTERVVPDVRWYPYPLLWPSLPWDGIRAMHRRRSSTSRWLFIASTICPGMPSKSHIRSTIPSMKIGYIPFIYLLYNCAQVWMPGSFYYYLIDNARSMRGELETFRFFDHNRAFRLREDFALCVFHDISSSVSQESFRIFSTSRYWPGFLELNTP